jgi:hypothetical protein
MFSSVERDDANRPSLAVISGDRLGAGFGKGAGSMSASVIAATRSMSEIGV